MRCVAWPGPRELPGTDEAAVLPQRRTGQILPQWADGGGGAAVRAGARIGAMLAADSVLQQARCNGCCLQVLLPRVPTPGPPPSRCPARPNDTARSGPARPGGVGAGTTGGTTSAT